MPNSLFTVDFFSLSFFANKDVLTPRLETECLLRKALLEIPQRKTDMIVDIGTWSGILAIHLQKRFPEISVFGLDISEKALEISALNAKNLQTPVFWEFSDLLEPWWTHDFSPLFPFFIANLPYIRTGDPLVGADVHENDPALALYGWEIRGTELIEKFLIQAKKWAIQKNVRELRILLEFGHDQDSIVDTFSKKLGYTGQLFSDYSGIQRFISLSYAPQSL